LADGEREGATGVLHHWVQVGTGLLDGNAVHLPHLASDMAGTSDPVRSWNTTFTGASLMVALSSMPSAGTDPEQRAVIGARAEDN
jgi:hypothetical protein